MWAFMPASANWTGSIPAAARCPVSGRHASGAAAGVPAVPAAAKYRLANAASSWVMNAGSAKKPWPSWLFTCRVTSRYMRLKHASPSAAGSAAAIASIRAIAPATETAGASGTGSAPDMAVTIGSPSSPRTKTPPSRPRPGTSEHRAERGK